MSRRLTRKVQQKSNGTIPKSPKPPLPMNGNTYDQDRRGSASQESFPPPPPEIDNHHGTLLPEHEYSYVSDMPPPPPPHANGFPHFNNHGPPISPRTTSTNVSTASPGSYKSYKSYMHMMQQNQNGNVNMTYEKMPVNLGFVDTPPASPSPGLKVAMPKLLAHECALAIKGDKTVIVDKKRHSRGHGSITSDISFSSPKSGGRKSKGGSPAYYELEKEASTAFPFPPPPGFATTHSPKTFRNKQAQQIQQSQQQGIYHVRSPKARGSSGKNTLWSCLHTDAGLGPSNFLVASHLSGNNCFDFTRLCVRKQYRSQCCETGWCFWTRLCHSCVLIRPYIYIIVCRFS